ncbi:hypothetical protein MRB53_037412 [Persea americana]|nr:hypothetical protein MRB53_037412 [Persea americana]
MTDETRVGASRTCLWPSCMSRTSQDQRQTECQSHDCDETKPDCRRCIDSGLLCNLVTNTPDLQLFEVREKVLVPSSKTPSPEASFACSVWARDELSTVTLDARCQELVSRYLGQCLITPNDLNLRYVNQRLLELAFQVGRSQCFRHADLNAAKSIPASVPHACFSCSIVSLRPLYELHCSQGSWRGRILPLGVGSIALKSTAPGTDQRSRQGSDLGHSCRADAPDLFQSRCSHSGRVVANEPAGRLVCRLATNEQRQDVVVESGRSTPTWRSLYRHGDDFRTNVDSASGAGLADDAGAGRRVHDRPQSAVRWCGSRRFRRIATSEGSYRGFATLHVVSQSKSQRVVDCVESQYRVSFDPRVSTASSCARWQDTRTTPESWVTARMAMATIEVLAVIRFSLISTAAHEAGLDQQASTLATVRDMGRKESHVPSRFVGSIMASTMTAYEWTDNSCIRGRTRAMYMHQCCYVTRAQAITTLVWHASYASLHQMIRAL